MTVERRPEQQALDRLILEIREQGAPELDWQRVEARLMREPAPAPRADFSRWLGRLRLPAAGLVAVSAVAAAVVAHRPAPPPPKVLAKLSARPLDGDQLALGTRITAGNQPLVVQHAGRARWTLEPHASASVSNAGELLTLALESGALSASVVPNPKPETFAVEVGGTRVAVHGTAFRVERAADRVLVEVSEGTVAVEPAGSHGNPWFLLRRDSRGSFALDGRTGSVEGNASAVVHDSGAQSHREVHGRSGLRLRVSRPKAAASSSVAQAEAPPNTSSEVASTPQPVDSAENADAAVDVVSAAAQPASEGDANASANLPLQPSISDIESGVSSAIVLMNTCFHDKTPSSGNHVSASTGLTLSINADGAVQSVTFAPPLAPAVEDCAVAGLRTLAFSRSKEGVAFTRLLELSR